mmetsp:Transcript_10488/g.18915  ORF Transcript_10488/g.18915 Transcript_10488/m.18915 type:complete len:82 (-) Transcript_10488:463-708(-)
MLSVMVNGWKKNREKGEFEWIEDGKDAFLMTTWTGLMRETNLSGHCLQARFQDSVYCSRFCCEMYEYIQKVDDARIDVYFD